MRGLFEISEDLHFLEDFLTETGGDITEEGLEAEIDKWLGDLGAERDTKIDNYCALIKQFEATAEARKVEAARIANLASIDANAAARLKARLHEFFKIHKIEKLETLRFKLARQKNGGQLAIIIDQELLDDPVKIPEEYRRTEYFPRRDEIDQALKAGTELGWAKYGERGEHLRIR